MKLSIVRKVWITTGASGWEAGYNVICYRHTIAHN